MKGMVDSFNVSVAAGILMHHAVCDRTSRLVMTILCTKQQSRENQAVSYFENEFMNVIFC